MLTKEARSIKKQLSFRLDEEQIKKLKIILIEENISLQKLIEDFLTNYISEHQDKK